MKKLKNLNAKVKVNPTFTVREWELFSELSGVEAAAAKLNQTLMQAINADDSTYSSVSDKMNKVMWELRRFGAADSEPGYLLSCVLERVYEHDSVNT